MPAGAVPSEPFAAGYMLVAAVGAYFAGHSVAVVGRCLVSH